MNKNMDHEFGVPNEIKRNKETKKEQLNSQLGQAN